MADAALKVLLRVVGMPNAPNLARRLPVSSKALQPLSDKIKHNHNVLEGLSVKVFSLYDDKESANMLEEVITEAGGVLSEGPDGKIDAIVCDTRGVDSTDKLTLLYTHLNPILPQLSKSGRVLLLAGDENIAHNVSAAAFSTAVGGFAKSIAHEVGHKGITANSLHIPSSVTLSPASNDCGVVQFLLSKRAAFITGQTISMRPLGDSEFSNSATDANPFPGSGSSSSGLHSSPAASSRFSVSGKRVVVTGAARGIGEYTARLYAAEGAEVLVVDHPAMEEHTKRLADDIGGRFLSLDVTDPASPDKLHDAIGSAFGSPQLDIMVHNAGITRDKTFGKMKEEGFRSVIDVNLGSIIRLDKMLLSRSKGVMQDGSRLVYLSSIAGIAGGFGQTNYSCSKAGVMGYVRAMAKEMSLRGIGINAVAPGFIETEMTAAIPFVIRNVGRRMNAMQQGGYPADIAEAILFLSSPAAAGINGSTIRVCGLHRVGA